jgi:AraC-like DNA-binding protein
MTTTQRVADYLALATLRRNYTADVMQHMQMSSTTLRRRLREEGTTLEALVKAEKKRRVEAAVAERPNINAKRLASECGYADVEHFYRAFRSWFGQHWSQYLRASR